MLGRIAPDGPRWFDAIPTNVFARGTFPVKRNVDGFVEIVYNWERVLRKKPRRESRDAARHC